MIERCIYCLNQVYQVVVGRNCLSDEETLWKETFSRTMPPSKMLPACAISFVSRVYTDGNSTRYYYTGNPESQWQLDLIVEKK